MSRPLKSIQYVANGCYYAINLSEQKQVTIQMNDIEAQKRSTIIIDETMLKQQKITIDDLAQAIYRQFIYEGLNKKNLFSHDREQLIMTFTYPKCNIKSMRFICEWKNTHQALSKDQRVAKHAEIMIKSMEEAFKKMFERYSKQTDAKLADALIAMQRNYQILSKRMEDRNQKKINQFLLKCEQIIRQYKILTRKTLEQQREMLIESNLRYFDEFRLIKTDLENSLMDCDLNIRELSNQVSDIRAFVVDHQDRTEDKVDKIKIDLSDLEKTTRFEFRQFNDKLIRLQALQPPQDANKMASKQTSQLQIKTSSTNERKSDSKQAQEETTCMPILSEKELRALPKQDTIFLEQ